MKVSMRFTRPRWIAWFWFLSAFTTCVVLGSWQVKRLDWKQGLAAQIEQAKMQAPLTQLPVDEAALTPLEFRMMRISGRWLKDKEFHLFPRWYQGKQGYWVIAPLMLNDRRILLVNRGWIPLEKKEPKTRPETAVRGYATVQGMLRIGADRHYLTPKNSPEKNIWFGRDIAAMASAGEFAPVIPAMLDRVGTQDAAALPVPSNGTITLRNDHLSYIITWYGIALGILVIFLSYHRKK